MRRSRRDPTLGSLASLASLAAFGTLASITLAPCARGQESQETPEAPAVQEDTIPALSPGLSYTGDFLTTAAGGAARGATFIGLADAELTIRLRQLIGWRGASVYVAVTATHGGSASRLVGDVQGVSNIEAPHTVRMEEAWLQQNLLGSSLSLLAGRYDVNSEFYWLRSAALFINSSFGIGADYGLSAVEGPSAFPFTRTGARVELAPSYNVALRAAVLDHAPVERLEGGALRSGPGGALLAGEVTLVRHPETTVVRRHHLLRRIGRGLPRPYASKLALGGWYYTARFPDLAATQPNGDPVLHRGSGGLYLLGDRVLWEGRGGSGPLAAFAQVGFGDGRVNQIGRYVGGGLSLTAPIRGRVDDQLGVAVAVAINGSAFERVQSAADPAANEVVVELTYLAQIGEWLSLQPDVQRVMHPGGTRGVRNATVLTLRLALTY